MPEMCPWGASSRWSLPEFSHPARRSPSGWDPLRLCSVSNVFRRSTDAAQPVAVRAEGATIWDADGRAYLDAAGGAVVVGIGHGRRSVADVMAAQAAQLSYAHGSAFTNEPLERYATALAPHLPVDDPAIYPVAGGSEAMETALK